MASFDPIFQKTLKHEGGFQKFPNDSANWVTHPVSKAKILVGTNRGISAQAYHNHYKKLPTEADMKALTEEQAKMIYKKNYWDKVAGDKIKNQSVAELMFQFIIGSGASQLSDLKDIANMVAGKKILASVDKAFTDEEVKVINALDAQLYFNSLRQWRHAYFLRIVKANAKLAQFLKGWQKRLDSYSFIPTPGDNSGKGAGLFFLMVGVVLILIAAGQRSKAKKAANKILKQ